MAKITPLYRLNRQDFDQKEADIIQQLKNSGLSIEEETWHKILVRALFSNRWEDLNFLIKKYNRYSYPEDLLFDILYQAVVCNRAETVSLILERGGKDFVNKCEQTPALIEIAFRSDRWDIMKLLLNCPTLKLTGLMAEQLAFESVRHGDFSQLDSLLGEYPRIDLAKTCTFDWGCKYGWLTNKDYNHTSLLEYIRFCYPSNFKKYLLGDYVNQNDVRIKPEWIKKEITYLIDDGQLASMEKLVTKFSFSQCIEHALTALFQHPKLEASLEDKKNTIIRKCINTGILITPNLLQQAIDAHQPVEIIALLIKKIDPTIYYEVNHNSVTNSETKEYLNNFNILLKLRKECYDYENYLRNNYQKTKLSQIEVLRHQLNDTHTPHIAIEGFAKSFNELAKNYAEKEIKRKETNCIDKQFLRKIMGPLTLFYAIYRGIKVNSFQFWKSRKQLFIEQITFLAGEVAAQPQVRGAFKG